MSFWFAPIIEQPVNKFGDGRLSNGASKFYYKIDRVHWLPLFKNCRESASRLGNLFNKRIYWLHERKFFEKSAVPLIFNQFADQRFQSVSHLRSEVNHSLSSPFSCIYNDLRCQSFMIHRKINAIKQCVSRRPTKTPCGRQALLKQNVMGDL